MRGCAATCARPIVVLRSSVVSIQRQRSRSYHQSKSYSSSLTHPRPHHPLTPPPPPIPHSIIPHSNILPRRCRPSLPNQSNHRGISTASLIAISAKTAPIALVGLIGGLIYSRYRSAGENEYLVRCSKEFHASNIKITKRGFVFPFQTHFFLRLQPREISFQVSAQTIDNQEFALVGMLTFGPKDSPEALFRFVKFLLASEEGCDHGITEMRFIEAVLESELERVCANLSLSSILSGGKAFKTFLSRELQRELDTFGVELYNFSILEIKHEKRVASTGSFVADFED